MIVVVLHGRPAEAEAAFKPIRAVRAAAARLAAARSRSRRCRAVRRPLPAGLQWYWKADFFEELTDEAIALHVKYGEQLPTPHSTMHLYPINGAAAACRRATPP